MIIGHGDIAKVLKDREGAIIFAAGVSNSQCEDESEYQREKKMIQSFSLHRWTSCFFYFSSISIFFKTSRYTKHKQEMESLVRVTYGSYNIIRLGNLTWGENPNTFLNFIRNRMKNNEPFEVRDEWKYMINRQNLIDVVNTLPLEGGRTISLFNEAMKVEQVVNEYLK